MKVQEFVQGFKDKKVMNTQIAPNAVAEYIKKTLAVREYVPFKEKRAIVELLVMKNIDVVDGVKKHDSISGYISFVMAMLTAHTSLQLSDNPIADYDVLSENKLLAPIIETFRTSYDECDVLLKMALAQELEDNNINMLFGRFLNSVLEKVDGLSEVLKSTMSNENLSALLGAKFNQEDLAKLSSFLDKYNK